VVFLPNGKSDIKTVSFSGICLCYYISKLIAKGNITCRANITCKANITRRQANITIL